MTVRFTHRLATRDDLPVLRELMVRAIRTFIGRYLDVERVEASLEIMGVDSQLIDDGTYFVVEQENPLVEHENPLVEHESRVVGCGGWSRRATMFGGDHSPGRNARRLDPATEPARVRAMYTHPDFGRQGIGRLVLRLCETAAASEGFQRLELVATVAGEPLYAAYGFQVIERIEVPTSRGLLIPCARMAKRVSLPNRPGA